MIMAQKCEVGNTYRRLGAYNYANIYYVKKMIKRLLRRITTQYNLTEPFD